MSNWALKSTPANVNYCAANPVTCNNEGFYHPFKVTIYNAPTSGTIGSRPVGSVIATVTQTKFVPWRPVAHVDCTGGAWKAGDGNCYNGYAFDLNFDLSSLGVTLPNDVVVGIAYNTQTYGAAPIGVDGPYNSLNVAVVGSVTAGADDNTNNVYRHTASFGTFREDSIGVLYGTIPIKISTMGNSLIVRPSSQLDWLKYTTNSGTVDFIADTSIGAPAPNGALNLVTIADNESRARYYRNVNVPLANTYQLGYSSRTVSAPTPLAAPSYAIGVYLDGTPSSFTNLVFEPYWANGTADTAPITPGLWQEWDVFSSNYLWASADVTVSGACKTTAGSGGPPFYSIAALKAACPNALVVSHAVYMGSYNPDWNSNVDLVRFNGTVWNFELDDPTVVVVDDDGFATAADCGASTPAPPTIQGGINAAAPGQIVKVCPGTYVEDVNINKANLILQGSGSGSTIISGPAGGGGDTVSITAAGVTVDGFTITRQGNAAATWNDPTLNNQGVNVAASANAVLQNNVITGNRNGIYVGQSSNNVIIRRNTIDFNRTGVHLVDNNGGLITENFIRNNWTMGVLYRTEGGVAPTALTVVGNHIAGNWYSEIEFREPAAGGLLNMSGNYLGTTNPTRVTVPSGEPGYAAQIPVGYPGGSAVAPASHPTIAGAQSARVDYSPFLYDGTDADLVTPGFQSAFNAVAVNADSVQAFGSANNLQEGLSMTASVGSLNVGTGTYNSGFAPSSKAISLRPGLSPGQVTIGGNLSLDANDSLGIEIIGTAPTLYDRLIVDGDVNLGGATLNLTSAFALPLGNTFTIIENNGPNGVSGTFAGLADGATITIGTNIYTINYAGGTGNDVVLTTSGSGPCIAVNVPTGIPTLTGVTVEVPINVADLTGRGAFGYDTAITYDPAVLQYLGIEQVGTLSSGLSIIPFNTPGTINLSAFSTGPAPLAGMGTLLKLRFTVIGGISTTSNINFSNFVFNEGNPSSCLTNGSVQVISGTLSGIVTYVNGIPTTPGVPNVNLAASGITPVTPGLTGPTGSYTMSGFGPGAYTVTPSKAALPLGSFNTAIGNADTTKIAQQVVGLAALTANQIIAGDVTNNGALSNLDATYISQWKVGIANPGVTGTWIFQTTNKAYANLNASISGENYNAILKGDATGNWDPLEPPSFTASLRSPKEISKDTVVLTPGSVKAVAGEEVLLPIGISDLTSRGVTGYEFEVRFDPDVLEPTDAAANTEATVSSGMNLIYNSPEPGRLIVFVYGIQPMQGAGELINLRFKAIGEAGSVSPITLVNLILNEGEIESHSTEGAIRLVESSSGVIRGKLRNSEGRPISGALISAVDSQGRVTSARTNPFGRFEIRGLILGETYTISHRSKTGRGIPVTVAMGHHLVEVDLLLE